MIKVIVISSVTPEPTSAGNMILYRHLTYSDSFWIHVISHLYPPVSINISSRIVKRLQKTRFAKIGNDLEVIYCGSSWKKILSSNFPYSKHLDKKRTVVLTVAHGDACWAAQHFAQQYHLPLVTFFHDWWPDIPTLHKPFRNLLENRFFDLYICSDLALCVSCGMKDTLGAHPNSQVIYPIPALLEVQKPHQNRLSEHTEFKVVYSGNLYDYGSMLGSLLETCKDNSDIFLQVRGANPNWSTEFATEMRDRNLWLDFAPREELNEWLASADAFLVVMSFDLHLRRRMETSFPSKLVEYAQFGKPLVIWGPEYCSAVQWARKGDRSLVITNENPKAFVSALETLKSSPQLQEYYSQQARVAAQTEFSPISLQSQFLKQVQALIEK